MKHTLVMAVLAIGMGLGTATVLAQNNNGGGNNGGGQGGGRGNRGNFDPAQFQQRIVENLRDTLEVKDDAEWSALEPLVTKVIEARMSNFGGMGRGMFGRRNRGGGNGGDNQSSDQQQPQRRSFGPPNPDADALQKAIDAKASKSEIKAALEKYVASRKAKQADLEKSQENLRKVLTSRQEAIATLNGLL